MAKRFTDTDKYKKPFIRGLQGAYKLLWDYLYHDCNHAGIWIVDFDIAQIYLGKDMQVNREDALNFFNKDEMRVIEFEENKWFIPSFIEFQYGELNKKNRAHNSVINILDKNNLLSNKGLTRGLYDPKDKDKDKELDKDKNKVNFDFIDLYIKEIGTTNEHDTWKESFYRNYKLKDRSLSKMLENFKTAQILLSTMKDKGMSEFKTHFTNWMNVQERNGLLTDFKRK